MELSASIISAAIGIISAVVAAIIMVRLFTNIKNSKNITIIKNNGERITFSKAYNREESKKLLEFIKEVPGK